MGTNGKKFVQDPGVFSRKGSKSQDYVRKRAILLVSATCVFPAEQVCCSRRKNSICVKLYNP